MHIALGTSVPDGTHNLHRDVRYPPWRPVQPPQVEVGPLSDPKVRSGARQLSEGVVMPVQAGGLACTRQAVSCSMGRIRAWECGCCQGRPSTTAFHALAAWNGGLGPCLPDSGAADALHPTIGALNAWVCQLPFPEACILSMLTALLQRASPIAHRPIKHGSLHANPLACACALWSSRSPYL